MKILYVTHRFPYPPNRGGKIRPFHMIKHLHQEHEVVVASLARSRQEARDGEGLGDFCERYHVERVTRPAATLRMVGRLPTSVPSSMGYFYSPRLKRRIDEELRTTAFDLIFVHCSSVAQYVQHVRDVPKIIDFGDMDSQKWLAYADVKPFPLSMGYGLEGRKLEKAEIQIARNFDLCTCTTAAEQETLDGFGTGVRTDWFPNGVNFDYFSPGDEEPEPNVISFVGRMDYFPNSGGVIDFCEEVLPLIQKRIPSAKLLIVGANPPGSITQLGALQGVTVTGSVPDVRPYLRRSVLSVAPLKIARGTQNKILESLAIGVPVVSSPQAAGGIDAVPGEHFLVASSPQEWADRVIEILEDPDRRRELSEKGQARMRSHHDWETSVKKLDQLISNCLSTKTTPVLE